MFAAAMCCLKELENMDVQIATEKKQQNQDGKIKQIVDKTNLHQAPTDGNCAQLPIKELPMLSPHSGEDLAYLMGIEAGKSCDLKSNPQFSTYSERIAYRAGWMDAMKKSNINKASFSAKGEA